MRLRSVYPIASIVVVLLLISGCQKQEASPAGKGGAKGPGGMPPVPVVMTKATTENIPMEVSAVGSMEASARVEVKSQVAGPLMRAAFTEGQNVKQGDLLFEIDPRPFEDALRQAEAQLAGTEAQLRQAQANMARDQAQARNAEADAGRYAELAKAGVISKSQNETVRTGSDVAKESVRASQAAIESSRAAIESDRAAIQRAKLDLSYTKIHAAISGRTGNLLIHPGNLVKVNDAPLVVIHRVTPIWAMFSVPEQHLPVIRRLQSQKRLQVRVVPKDEGGEPASGQLSVIENTVDASTGTIRLKAAVANQKGVFWPGQFVNVVLSLGSTANATVIPSAAVQEGQRGPFVYVVKNDQTVEPRNVKVDRTVGTRSVIREGVNAGETVITDGHMRLFPGAKVVPADTKRMEALQL